MTEAESARGWRGARVLALVASACLACAGLVVGGTPVEEYPGTRLFEPAEPAPVAVVVLHGSEGGRAPFAPWLAGELARRGLLAASFCWFGCDTLPERIQHIPLDRTVEFVDWLRAGPASGTPVVLYGASRGAELALLLGSLEASDARVAAVASHAGSDTVVAAFDPATGGPVEAEGGYDAAWTWKGKPLYGERALPYGSGPAIDLARYPGPVFLSHGERDALWPAERSRRLEAARAAAGLPTVVRYWPDGGHVLQSRKDQVALVDALEAFARSVAVP